MIEVVIEVEKRRAGATFAPVSAAKPSSNVICRALLESSGTPDELTLISS